MVREAFEQSKSGEGRIGEALEAIKRGPAIRKAKELSRHYAEEALASLKKLPASPYRNGLKTLVSSSSTDAFSNALFMNSGESWHASSAEISRALLGSRFKVYPELVERVQSKCGLVGPKL